jgi:hypothetical protein
VLANLSELSGAAIRQARATVRGIRSRCTLAVLVAAAGALLGALLGVGAGQWIGWSTAGPLPTDEEAAAVARLALAGPVPAPTRFTPIFGYDGNGGYGPGRVRFVLPADPDAAAFAWQTKDVRVRLGNAGWHVDKGSGTGLVFVADKGGQRVRYSTGPHRVRFDVVRAQPMWVLPAGAAVGLLGAVFGWVVTRWAWRNGVRRPLVRRRAASGVALLGAALVLPAAAVAVYQQGRGYAHLSRPGVPLWSAVAVPVPGVLAAIGVTLLLATMFVAGIGAVADPDEADAAPEPARAGV